MGDKGTAKFLESAEVLAILEAPPLRSLPGLRYRCMLCNAPVGDSR